MRLTRTHLVRGGLAALALSAPVAVLAQQQKPAPAAPQQQAAQQAAPTVQPQTRESQALPSLAPLVDSVKSAVVNVDVQARPGRRGGPRGMPDGQSPDDFFDRFFGGGQRPERERIRQGAGSGFIIDPRGVVLTNNHVVESAVTIRVRLDDGRSFDAEVVGRDPLTDVAVLKLKGNPSGLPTVRLGDSDALRVGDWVVAIGNPFGLASSVSAGILSARAREIGASNYDDFLQTDAAINPGNSGGPLFNMRGEVIGINTAIVGGGTGIGFAVPSNLIKAIIPQLQSKGAVTRAFLGVTIQDLTPELARALGVSAKEGAIVTGLNEEGPSPAKAAGIRPDDVIVAIDGEKVDSGRDLTRTVALKKPGSATTLTLFRGGKQQDVKVKLAERPDFEGVAERGGLSGPEDDEQSSRQRVGVSLRDLDPRTAQGAGFTTEQGGALITDVVPGSAADHAELAPGWVVVEANKQPVRRAADLQRIIRAAPKGSTVLLRLAGPGGARGLRALTMP